MGKRTYEDIKEMLCKELDGFAKKGEISSTSLDMIHKLTDSIKNIDKIEMLEGSGYSEARYSRDGGWEARGSYGRGGSYDGGSSYEGGSSYANRRGTHYVRGHYSRDGGYSRDDAKQEMMENLEEMMGSAESEKAREAIKRCMEQIRNA